VDALIGILLECEQSESDISHAALQAGLIRRAIVVFIMICSATACVLQSAPICEKNDVICLANTAMASAIINALGVLFLFINEKVSSRNNAVRWRDLSTEFAALGNELRSSLYTSPPPPQDAQSYVVSVSQRAADLKQRAVSANIKPRKRNDVASLRRDRTERV
jgi:hypothetical protein